MVGDNNNEKDMTNLPSDSESTTLLTYIGANLVKNEAALAIRVVARLWAEVRNEDNMALLWAALPGSIEVEKGVGLVVSRWG